MEISLYEALVVMGIGLTGLIGSIHLENQLSTISIGVAMGPAKYTGVISLILLVCGIISVIGHLRRRRAAGASATPRIATARGMTLMAILLAWVAAVSILGFNIASLCFFPMLFYVSGFRPWFKSIVVGVITAVLFYVVFVLGARLPVPKGGFRI
jgi:putative tricarboxylic transport membrane protein